MKYKIYGKTKNKKTEKINYLMFLTGIVFTAVTVLLIALARSVFTDYRNTLMQNQQTQLLELSETLGQHISLDMREYVGELDYLEDLEKHAVSDEIYKDYINESGNFLENIFWEDSDGNVIRSILKLKLSEPLMITVYDDRTSIYQYSAPEEKDYLVLKRTTSDGRRLCLAVSEDEYYHSLISDIQIGTNGYVVIKNSDNIMLMHPEKAQWGINVIADRIKMYPDVDLGSLEQMLEHQKQGQEGVEEYYSYWWTDPSLPRVRKISAYCPAYMGEDFWIVSAVLDYADFYAPIQEGFSRILIIFSAILLIFMVAAIMMARLLYDNTKASREINYLKNLNETLEEVHKSEETIAHQQRLQIMGTVAGGIAHEFNNFLTPIMGHAELLMMTLPEDSEEYDSAREILDASEKARDVVKQMSGLSRKNVETVYQNLDAAKLINRNIRMIRSICPERIALKTENCLKDEHVLGNSTQINQVLLNITVNAIQAIGMQEGHISIRAEASEVSKLGYPEIPEDASWKKYILISIRDDGPGMSQDTIRHIFDPFFTTKPQGEGTGLGLALAQQIIGAHRGFIHVDSKLTEGSCFIVGLPVVDAEETSGIPDLERDSLLIVDDNHKILNLLEQGLKPYSNLRVRTADSREACESLLLGERPSAVVADQRVGNADGVELMMSLLSRYPEVIRIIMTDTIDRELMEAKQRGIIQGILQKPVSGAQILELIEEIRTEEA